MIKVAILGDIGSGKTFVSNKFGYPVFNADKEVANIYKKNKACFLRLKKKFPKFINTYPIDKNELKDLILKNSSNIKKIPKIVHPLVRLEMKRFLRRNAKKKMVILDIPLYIENQLNQRKDILIYVDAKKKEIEKVVNWYLKILILRLYDLVKIFSGHLSFLYSIHFQLQLYSLK